MDCLAVQTNVSSTSLPANNLRRSGFWWVLDSGFKLVRCANLLAAGPSISIINVHKFGT